MWFVAAVGCGGGVATPPPTSTGAGLPTSNETIGVEVGFTPLGISIRQTVDPSQNPVFTVDAVAGQRTIPTVDLSGMAQAMDVIVEEQPFTPAVFPDDDTISAFGETFCVMVVAPGEAVAQPCSGEPQTLAEPVTLSFAFDPAKVPTGFTAADATVFLFDGIDWWDVGGTVDANNGTVSVASTQGNLVKVIFRDSGTTQGVTLTDLRLEASQTTFNEGDTGFLRAYAMFSDHTLKEVTGEAQFVISDQSRAFLTGTNTVKAVSAGQTTIIASYQGKASQTVTLTIVDEVAPQKVGGVNASVLPSGSGVFLSWTPVGDSDVAFYEVYQASTPFTEITATGVDKVGQTTSAFTTTFTLEPVADGTYHFAVVAVDDSGNKDSTPASVPQVTLADTTPPPAVTGVVFSKQTDGGGNVTGIVLDWSSYNSDDAVKFTIRRASSNFANVNDAQIVADNVTEKVFVDETATTPGTTYFYAVVAIDAKGNQLTDLGPGVVGSFSI